MNTDKKTVKIAVVAVMTALATVIYFVLPEIPLVPGVDYLKIDLSDLPAILTGVICGPVSAVFVEVLKNVFHLFKSTTYGIGELINVGIGSVIVVSVSLFGRFFGKLFGKGILHPAVFYISAAVTLFLTVVAGWLLNALLTPLYFSIMGWDCSFAVVKAGVIGSTLLNVVKAAINLFPFYPLYYAAFRVFKKK